MNEEVTVKANDIGLDIGGGQFKKRFLHMTNYRFLFYKNAQQTEGYPLVEEDIAHNLTSFQDVQTLTGKPLTFSLSFRNGQTVTCAATSVADFTEWRQLISPLVEAHKPAPPPVGSKPRPISGKSFDSSGEPHPPSRPTHAAAPSYSLPVSASTNLASHGSNSSALEANVSVKNSSLLFTKLICPLFEKVGSHGDQCSADDMIPRMLDALASHRQIASQSNSLAALEEFLKENQLVVETTIDSRPLPSVSAFLLMSFVAFLENKGYIAPKGAASPREHHAQRRPQPPTQKPQPPTQKPQPSSQSGPPAVPSSKPSSFRRTSSIDHNSSSLTTTAASDRRAGFNPPPGAVKMDFGAVHLRKTSIDTHTPSPPEVSSSKPFRPPSTSKPTLTVTSTSSPPAVPSRKDSDEKGAIDFDRLEKREKLDTIKRPGRRGTVLGSQSPQKLDVSQAGDRRSVRGPKRKPKSRPASVMLSLNIIEQQAKEESLNEVKTAEEIGEMPVESTAITTAETEAHAPSHTENAPKKRFSGVPMFGMGMVPNVGPSMLKRSSGSNQSLKTAASGPTPKSTTPTAKAEDDSSSQADFRSLLKARQQKQQQQSPVGKPSELQRQSSAPQLPAKKFGSTADTTSSSDTSKGRQMDFRNLLKRNDDANSSSSSLSSNASSGRPKSQPDVPSTPPPRKTFNPPSRTASCDSDSSQPNFLSVLKKKKSENTTTAAPPQEDKETNQQMDFRSILKKRKE